jgi:hypothetical protein
MIRLQCGLLVAWRMLRKDKRMVVKRADEKSDASEKSGFFLALDAYENPGAGKKSEVC